MVLTKPINIENGPFTNYQMFVKDIVKNVKLQFCKLDKAPTMMYPVFLNRCAVPNFFFGLCNLLSAWACREGQVGHFPSPVGRPADAHGC